jgi:hypothetical protein
VRSTDGILKSGCSGWEVSAGDTFYFKPGVPMPHLPTSSCVHHHGVISDPLVCTVVANGTYNGTACGGTCPLAPNSPPLTQQLAEFASKWQNVTWTEASLPSAKVGNPVAMAKKMLAKYPK